MTMANVRKYGLMRPVKRIYNPIRWTPKRKNRNREKKKEAIT